MKQDTTDVPYAVKLTLSGYWEDPEITKPVLEMIMQQGEVVDELSVPRQLAQDYQIKLYKGHLTLMVQVWRETGLNESEISFAKSLVADMAEVLKLFANGDVFMKVGVERLIAEIARETGVEDPTASARELLIKSPYMKNGQSELRRYYRLYDKRLNHAHPQLLLERRREALIETDDFSTDASA